MAIGRNVLFFYGRKDFWAHVLFKVMPTVLFGLAALQTITLESDLCIESGNIQCGGPESFVLILAMFVLFAAGDFALIFERKFAFYLGLVSFLSGHLVLIALLWSLGGGPSYWAVGLAFLLATSFPRILMIKGWPLRAAVHVYAFIIGIMVAVSLIQSWPWLLVAALLFAVSDAFLAFRKFEGPFLGADYLVWNLYWISILLFALFLPPALLA